MTFGGDLAISDAMVHRCLSLTSHLPRLSAGCLLVGTRTEGMAKRESIAELESVSVRKTGATSTISASDPLPAPYEPTSAQSGSGFSMKKRSTSLSRLYESPL